MDEDPRSFLLTVETTTHQCPIGEIVGDKNQAERKIPVFSCEGACIRGEIARQAASIVAMKPAFGTEIPADWFSEDRAVVAA